MIRVLAHTMMHIWCEYGECNLNRSGVITLTRYNDFEDQGHELEDEGQYHPSGANMVNVA